MTTYTWETTETEYLPEVIVTYTYEYYTGPVNTKINFGSDWQLKERLEWVNKHNHIIQSFNVTVDAAGRLMYHMLVHEIHEEPAGIPADPEDEFNDYETEGK